MRENLRDRGIQIDYPLSTKQWINALPPIAQAKLWNNTSIRKDVAKTAFKLDSKMEYQSQYALELYNNQEIYADYWKVKREEEQQNKTLTEDQYNIVNKSLSHLISLIIVTHTHRPMGLEPMLLNPCKYLAITCQVHKEERICLLYTSPSPRDLSTSRMPSSA